MNGRKVFNRIVKGIGAVILSLLVCFSAVFEISAPKAFADSTELTFDSSPVMEDLGDLDLSGFDPSLIAEPRLLSFMEYSFSDNVFQRDNYALYAYVFNPLGKRFVTFTGANVVNMASEYATSEDGSFAQKPNGAYTPTKYQNFSLKYCNASENGWFVKFRVMGLEGVLANVAKMQTQSGERQYDLVGIQLHAVGEQNAVDYAIADVQGITRGGRTFIYTGFAKGYGTGAESKATLACRYEDLGVADLEVFHTSYKTGVSSAGKGHQNELHSVYFAVDNRFIEAYGRLQKIAAQWWEYKVVPSIVATSEIYNKLLPYVGVDIGVEFDDDEVDTSLPYSIVTYPTSELIDGATYLSFDYTYNYTPYSSDWLPDVGPIEKTAYNETMLKLLFEVPSNYPVNSWTVKGEEVLEAALAFESEAASGETLPVKDGNVAADCFTGEVDAGRTRGYNFREFDADNVDDQWDLFSYDDTHNFLATFFDYGFFWPDNLDETLEDVSPIHCVTDKELSNVSNEAVAKALLIDENDVADFRTFYATETAKDKTVVLFRFAATDYTAVPLRVEDLSSSEYISTSDNINAELRQGTAFLDFEIISLTFNKDGELTVIGAVCSPIDAMGDLSPAIVDGGCADFDPRRLFAIMIIVLVVVAVVGLIDKIGQANQRRKVNAIYKSTKKKK